MTGLARLAGLPAIAVALVSGVLAVQVANGGVAYEPLRPANPCASRSVTSVSDGIDGLTERLVLLAVDDAACTLHLSRESLTLELARPGTRTEAEVDALHEGLLAAVRRMAAEGSLPPAHEHPRRRCARDRRRPHPRDRQPRPASRPRRPRQPGRAQHSASGGGHPGGQGCPRRPAPGPAVTAR